MPLAHAMHAYVMALWSILVLVTHLPSAEKQHNNHAMHAGRACLVHQAVPLERVQALEGYTGEVNLEVGLPAGLSPACHPRVPRMLTGLVLYHEPALRCRAVASCPSQLCGYLDAGPATLCAAFGALPVVMPHARACAALSLQCRGPDHAENNVQAQCKRTDLCGPCCRVGSTPDSRPQ